jgi:hypothetical protein
MSIDLGAKNVRVQPDAIPDVLDQGVLAQRNPMEGVRLIGAW